MVPLPHLIEEHFIRASGPGGQNVNKVSSAVQLLYDAKSDPRLGPGDRARLERLASHLFARDGRVQILARAERTQSANRRAAREQLSQLLQACRIAPQRRRPTRVSKTAKRRRTDLKTQRGRLKQLRQRPVRDD
ncbi:MAG: alternative ribosome rescue aminoacyl-tRNA hydrolase ArfB [Pseudomonadota bacterium]|mgnify:CR=1 FL=1